MTQKTEILTVEPEYEPEYVGAHSEPTGDECCNWQGEYQEDVEQCGDDATHTVVMRSPNGTLSEIPMCDECGEPQDVDAHVL